MSVTGVGNACEFDICCSSPRVWGTPAQFDLYNANFRFIPTSVGNTISIHRKRIMNAVHPHECGEHGRLVRPMDDIRGSSPRVWGTQQHSFSMVGQWRFIPTSVGNTLFLVLTRFRIAVHPHECGEHCRQLHVEPFQFGSSPRVWGTLFRVIHGVERWRFIPTSVGNTASS